MTFTRSDFKPTTLSIIVLHFSTLPRPKPVRAFNKPSVKEKLAECVELDVC